MRAVKRLPSVVAVLGLTCAGVVLPTVQVEAKPAPVAPTLTRLAVPSVPAARQQTLAAATSGTASARVAQRTVVASLTSTGTGFDVAGVSFDGAAPAGLTVEARTRGASGWSPWFELAVDDDGGPDAGSADARGARSGTEPLAAAGSTGLEVRVATAGAPAPRGLSATLVDAGESDADAAVAAPAGAAVAAVRQPTIVTRAAWGADESLRKCTSERLSGYQGAVVHHTVNSNTYTQAQVPSLLRGMYAYHTQTLGWCDLGYQFLVDRFGRIYEGRSGALTSFVQGAQTGGFNADTFGVSVIGDHRTVPFSAATKASVAAVIAWVAGRAGFDPAGSATFVSAGNSKYAYGTKVVKPRVSAHRDYGLTECPGNAGYAQVPSIRATAASTWAAGQQTFTPMAPKTALEAFARPAGTTVTLAGHGWGHGRGMSQYGAYGAALQGLSAARITSFYYPNTVLASQGDPAVRIYLSALGSSGTTVSKQTGLTLSDGRSSLVLPSTADRWRVVPDGGGLTLQWLVGSTWTSSGYWKAWTAPITLSRPSTGVLRVVLPSGVLRDYPGAVTTRAWGSGARSINLTRAELHTRSVVPVEMPASWPAAALQTQAIAARSFAAYGRAHAPSAYYDTCDSTSCQVYRGLADYGSTGALRTSWLDSRATAATTATAGRIVTYDGAPALAQFGSSNGGMVVGSSLPYQMATVDPYDGAAVSGVPHSWTATLSVSKLQSAYPSTGTFSALTVLARSGGGDWGGRVTSVRVTGSAGSVTVSGDAFVAAMGLRSTWWVVTSAPAASGRLMPRDLTADGLPDALAPISGGLVALAYSGNRSFVRRTLAPSGWAGLTLVTGVGPFDGDTLGDVVARRGDGSLWLYPGSASGKLDRAPERIATGWGSVDLVVPVGDISGDGHTDLLARTTSGALVLHTGDGAGALTGSRQVGAGWGIFSHVTAGDFDGDGRIDLAAVRASDGRLLLYAGLPGGTFRAAQVIGTDDWRSVTEFLSVGDLTGDGRHDLLVRRRSDGMLLIHPVSGTVELGTPITAGIHPWTTRLGQ